MVTETPDSTKPRQMMSSASRPRFMVSALDAKIPMSWFGSRMQSSVPMTMTPLTIARPVRKIAFSRRNSPAP